MSYDILPKNNLQYTLSKLKTVFDDKVDKEAGKGLFSGSYTDLTNKPTIPSSITDMSIPSGTTDGQVPVARTVSGQQVFVMENQSGGGGGSNTGTFIVDTNGMSIGDTVRVRSMFNPLQTEDKQVVTVGTPLIFTVPSRDYYKVCTVEQVEPIIEVRGIDTSSKTTASIEVIKYLAGTPVIDDTILGMDIVNSGNDYSNGIMRVNYTSAGNWSFYAVKSGYQIGSLGTITSWDVGDMIGGHDYSYNNVDIQPICAYPYHCDETEAAEIAGLYYTVDDGQTHYVNNIFDKTTLRGIQAILNAHQESNMLAIGDEVTVKINGVDEIYFILAMNVYASHEVIFGWKYVSETLTATPINYSSRATVNTYCDNILANMTSEDRALIKNKTVNYSHSGNMAYTDRKIWLPTRQEVFGDQANEASTNTQLTYFVTQANRIRSQKGGSATEWQTATSNADGSKVITTSTTGTTSTSSSAKAVMPCFHLTSDV